jgi:hypothetical protein
LSSDPHAISPSPLNTDSPTKFFTLRWLPNTLLILLLLLLLLLPPPQE